MDLIQLGVSFRSSAIIALWGASLSITHLSILTHANTFRKINVALQDQTPTFCMPPPVLRVEIPKGDGGIRKLGIPAITDRIAQMVVKQRIEPELEQHFHPNSYGYRPNKSALELTNGFQKKTQKTPKSEILLSEQRKQDYLERNSNE